MQIIQMVSMWVEKQNTSISTLTVFKSLPFIIMAIPLVNVILDISSNAENISDFYISETAYTTLIVETAPMVGTFIFVWAIAYVLILFGYYRYGSGL